jgi:hypothetical protein
VPLPLISAMEPSALWRRDAAGGVAGPVEELDAVGADAGVALAEALVSSALS